MERLRRGMLRMRRQVDNGDTDTSSPKEVNDGELKRLREANRKLKMVYATHRSQKLVPLAVPPEITKPKPKENQNGAPRTVDSTEDDVLTTKMLKHIKECHDIILRQSDFNNELIDEVKEVRRRYSCLLQAVGNILCAIDNVENTDS